MCYGIGIVSSVKNALPLCLRVKVSANAFHFHDLITELSEGGLTAALELESVAFYEIRGGIDEPHAVNKLGTPCDVGRFRPVGFSVVHGEPGMPFLLLIFGIARVGLSKLSQS